MEVPFGHERTPKEIEARITWEEMQVKLCKINMEAHQYAADAYRELLRYKNKERTDLKAKLDALSNHDDD